MCVVMVGRCGSGRWMLWWWLYVYMWWCWLHMWRWRLHVVVVVECNLHTHTAGKLCTQMLQTHRNTRAYIHAYSCLQWLCRKTHVQQGSKTHSTEWLIHTHSIYRRHWCFTCRSWHTVWHKCVFFTFQRTTATPIPAFMHRYSTLGSCINDSCNADAQQCRIMSIC